MTSLDVTVVGGGFAGVAAARDLGQAGFSVLLLEASDRLGGRTMVGRFAGTSQLVDLGGTWVLPDDHPTVMAELDHYGIGTDPTPTPERFVNLLGEERLTSASPDRRELEPLCEALLRAPARTDGRPTSLDDVMVGLPKRTRAWAAAYARYLAGCSPTEADAARWRELPVEAWTDVDRYSHKIEGGTRHLIEAMANDVPFDARFESLVTSIVQTTHGVTISCRGGTAYVSRFAVVALPVNVWHSIIFEPELSSEKKAMAGEGHAGHSVRLWMLVDGVPDNFRGVASDGPIAYVRTERSWPDGRSLLVAFGPDVSVGAFDRGPVEQSLRRFLPKASLGALDGHDWNADPLAREHGSRFAPVKPIGSADDWTAPRAASSLPAVICRRTIRGPSTAPSPRDGSPQPGSRAETDHCPRTAARHRTPGATTVQLGEHREAMVVRLGLCSRLPAAPALVISLMVAAAAAARPSRTVLARGCNAVRSGRNDGAALRERTEGARATDGPTKAASSQVER